MKQFYKLYQEVLQNEKLTRTQQAILSILINRQEYHKNKAFYCYVDWIASEIKCSERTVKRAIKYFAEIGLVSISKTYKKEIRKTTNWYRINIDTTNNGVVVNNEVSGTMEDTNKTENNMRDIDEVLQPIDEDIDIKQCKMIIDNEVISNIKNHLINNINKKNKSTVYYPAIKEKFGYDYKTVIESVKQLSQQNIINYQPEEKDGKIYHYYSVPPKFNEEKYNETLGKWYDLVVQHINKINTNGYNKQMVINDLQSYAGDYLKDGVTATDLQDMVKIVFNKNVA